MKNISEIDDNINELIMQKSFSQLSADEKKKAMEYAGSEEEYNTLRATLLAITTSFNAEEEVFADASLKSDLMNQFEKKFGKDNNRIKIIPFYRQPLFQLAAAASIALLVFFTFPFLDNKQGEGQLAMNTAPKEEPAEKASGETTEGAATTVTGTTHLEPKANKLADKKDTDGKDVSLEENKAEETVFSPPPPSIVTEEQEKLKGDELHKDVDDLAAEDLKTTNGNLSLSKPSKKKEEDIFLFDKVAKEHRERDTERKNKKKEAEKNRTMEDPSKAEGKKLTEFELTEKDAVVNAAAGSSFETVPAAPGHLTATVTANRFLEENNSAMMDLLFTAF